jgi:hypothetical protein
MRRLVPFKLADGSEIMVEVDEPDTGGAIRAGGIQDRSNALPRNFDEAMKQIHTATESAINNLLSLSLRPDSIDMEFGFNLTAEFGAVIAKGTAEATYKVTLRWDHSKEESSSK